MGGEGWLNTLEYRHIGGMGLKLLKKPSYDIGRSLTKQADASKA